MSDTHNNTLEMNYLFKLIGIITGITLIGNVILFFIGDSMDAFPDDLEIINGNGNILGLEEIIIFTVLTSILGPVIYSFLYNRNSESAKKIFGILSILVLLFFVYGPFGSLDASTETIVFLQLMHFFTAITIVGILFTKIPQK